MNLLLLLLLLALENYPWLTFTSLGNQEPYSSCPKKSSNNSYKVLYWCSTCIFKSIGKVIYHHIKDLPTLKTNQGLDLMIKDNHQ